MFCGWLCLLAGLPAYAADKSWNMIRYQGGTVEAKVNPFDWNTTLTIVNGGVDLNFAGRKRLRIEASDITVLSFGESAYKHVSDIASLRYAPKPVKLFGMLSKPRDHLVSIEFKTAGGTVGGVLLEVYFGHSMELLHALRILTGKPVDNWP